MTPSTEPSAIVCTLGSAAAAGVTVVAWVGLGFGLLWMVLGSHWQPPGWVFAASVAVTVVTVPYAAWVFYRGYFNHCRRYRSRS